MEGVSVFNSLSSQAAAPARAIRSRASTVQRVPSGSSRISRFRHACLDLSLTTRRNSFWTFGTTRRCSPACSSKAKKNRRQIVEADVGRGSVADRGGGRPAARRRLGLAPDSCGGRGQQIRDTRNSCDGLRWQVCRRRDRHSRPPSRDRAAQGSRDAGRARGRCPGQNPFERDSAFNSVVAELALVRVSESADGPAAVDLLTACPPC